NGCQMTIDCTIAKGNGFNITTAQVAGASPVSFRWNGGPNDLSSGDPNNGNWSNGVNALRLLVANAGAAANTQPIRVELDQGAMFVLPNVATLVNPLTVRGVPDGDPT